jgi:hypothetical protein
VNYVSVNSSSAHPPRAFAAFPNPGGGAIADFFSPGWGLRRFPLWGDLADFAGKDIEFICKWLDTHSLEMTIDYSSIDYLFSGLFRNSLCLQPTLNRGAVFQYAYV